MAGTLGTVYGQVQIDTKQAVLAYSALRAANASTLYALRGGSTAFAAAGVAIGGMGLAMGAGFAKAISAAADFEKQLDFFGATSNSTQAEMEAVRKKALQLGKDTRYSASEIAVSFTELGKAGVSAHDIVNGVGEAVANLGAAADIPLDKAANIITSAIQTFKLGAEDAVRITDLLAGAANASIVDIEDLGVSLKYVGGVAASISIPIEDTIDAISLLGKAGIRGSTAGTSLRQILVSLSGTSKKATKKLKELGIVTADGTNKFFTAEGKAKSMSEIFQVLQDHTKGLTEAQRLSAFKIIFNNRALAAAAILTREGADGFAKMNAEIGKTTAADVARKRLDNLSGDIEILKGNIETLLIEAGSPFQNFLRGIVQGATRLLTAFTSLSPGTQEFIFKALALTAALLIVMGTVATVVSIMFKFYETMILLRGGITVVMTVLKSLRLALAATWLAALGPIAIVIAIVLVLAGLFILLWKRSETFRDIVKGVGAAIVTAFRAVVAFFQSLPGFFQGLWGRITGAFTGAVTAIQNAWNAVGAFFQGLWNTITTALTTFGVGFVNFWTALPGRILGFVSSMATAIVGFIATLPERVAYWLGFMVGRAIRLMIDFNKAMHNGARDAFWAVVNWIKQLPGRIATFFQTLYNNTVTRLTSWKNFISNTAQAAFNAAINWLKNLPGRIATYFQNLYNDAVNKWRNIKTTVSNGARDAFNAAVNWLKDLPGRIASYFQGIYDRAVAKWESIRRQASNAGTSIKDAVINGVKALPGLLSDLLQRAIDTVSNLGGAAYNKAKNIGSSLWNGFKDGMGIKSPSYIEKAMFQVAATMKAETRRMEKNVASLQGLGARLPNIQEMVTATRNAQGERVAISAGATQLGRLPSAPQAQATIGHKTEINLTTVNPVGETTVETLSKEATRMGMLGVLPR